MPNSPNLSHKNCITGTLENYWWDLGAERVWKSVTHLAHLCPPPPLQYWTYRIKTNLKITFASFKHIYFKPTFCKVHCNQGTCLQDLTFTIKKKKTNASMWSNISKYSSYRGLHLLTSLNDQVNRSRLWKLHLLKKWLRWSIWLMTEKTTMGSG